MANLPGVKLTPVSYCFVKQSGHVLSHRICICGTAWYQGASQHVFMWSSVWNSTLVVFADHSSPSHADGTTRRQPWLWSAPISASVGSHAYFSLVFIVNMVNLQCYPTFCAFFFVTMSSRLVSSRLHQSVLADCKQTWGGRSVKLTPSATPLGWLATSKQGII